MQSVWPPADAWFTRRHWTAFPFQHEVWHAMAEGRSGLLHATTGAGKTYAVWLGALARAAQLAIPMQGRTPPPLGVLWITPMRALSADTQRAMALPLPELAPHWTLGLRSGDTPSAERARQDKRLPTALVTTPESLTLLLTRADAAERLQTVHTVIVDEWHEMVGNKRGVQVQLALARLAQWNPQLIVWGLSATLGNLDEAMQMLLGPKSARPTRRPAARLVRGATPKTLLVDTLLPHEPGRFSWGGHLGKQMLAPVVAEIERSGPTLVFTNVRSQAEAWYQMLLNARPDWAGQIALHHGSLDKSVREWVEAGLKAGSLRAVVATSSLDLGVDFLPVERVLQIGSAKGVARLLQRAGRSGHQPGRASRITLVPTNTLELIEAVAARRAVAAQRIEQRHAPDKPLDVLVQHLVSVALGGGFTADALYAEVCRTHSFQALSREEFQWALDFVVRGGASLGAYPEYHRVVEREGVHRVEDRGIALRHRLQVGTIVAESSMLVKWLSGGTLGQIEEGFIARLNKGDCFVFGGRVLEYVRTQDMAVYVRKAAGKRGIVPSWAGSKMPLSSELADATLEVLDDARRQALQFDDSAAADPELIAARPMLDAQLRLSRLPTPSTLLVEQFRSREGHHLFLYPFAGRHVHLGLASLLGWRLARERPNTFSISINDYGFELLAADSVDIAGVLSGSSFTAGDELLHDVLASLNSSELARRRFREIARVAGLVFTGYPGAPKSTKQLQASSSLFYEVFRQYDPGNRLLGQADAEVLAQELDLRRLRAAMQRMQRQRIEPVTLRAPSPFALALMVERFREQLSTEKLADRLARIIAEAEGVLDEAPPAQPAGVPRGRRSRAAGQPSPGRTSSE
ncbi:ligase-associated DNA damage response DEXH box helicase [Aquabacterium sp.]|uniref:ligase-associated DNA damage response DEXH box helicase n=1 Tax=Aquabacterium sp. TaxID=1872578 RepID=UPI002BE016A2|nr:ligase-associated DNA damage response DEXH box helicase [Aquabacterium sp.]HSW05440.1 ligase-associated DNA damage response DEXH box helicase [Aquabacterium sp.]